jgi:hypothetical protein
MLIFFIIITKRDIFLLKIEDFISRHDEMNQKITSFIKKDDRVLHLLLSLKHSFHNLLGLFYNFCNNFSVIVKDRLYAYCKLTGIVF